MLLQFPTLAGLHLAHLATELSPGSKVATSPISFVASANSIIYAGYNPVFVDIDIETGNLSISALKLILEKHDVKTLVPVHYAGMPCDMLNIHKICKEKNIYIIEDAAHAFGASYDSGEKVGSCKYSDMAVFSFHPVKSITTGEGGIITTNNKSLYEKLIKLRTHGVHRNETQFQDQILSHTNGVPNPWYYEMSLLGYNYRMTDIQAALGCSQMKKIDKFMNKRKKIAKKYDRLIPKIMHIKPVGSNNRNKSGNHLYAVKIDFSKINLSRNDLMNKLRAFGIITQVHYLPIPLHVYYKNLGYTVEHLPNALNFYFQILSLPIFPKLRFYEQKKVLDSLKKLI